MNCISLNSFTLFLRPQIFFFIEDARVGTATSFSIIIQTNNGSDISNFLIGWLTVDPSFPNPFSIGYVDLNYSTVLTAPFNNWFLQVNFTASTGVVMNTSHIIGAIGFLTIFKGTSNSYCFNIQLDYFLLNQNFYQVNAYSYCQDLIVYTFGFSRILFDQTLIENFGYSYFNFDTLQSQNSDYSPFTFFTDPYDPSTYMVGLQTFNITGQQQSLDFTSLMGPTTTIIGTTNFIYLSFNYWSFRLRDCPVGIPYYLPPVLLCYDICPDTLYGENSTNLCMPCNSTCYNCSSFNICTSCDPLNNREINSTNCIPSPGYYESYAPSALPCSIPLPNCLICLNNATCTSCNTSYYINSAKTCTQCFSDCIECSLYNGTVQCSQCVKYYQMGPNNASCIAPNCSDVLCVFCPNDQNICQACMDGYLLNSKGDCVPICGDFIKTPEQQCDDGNLINSDGCSSTCQIQPGFTCQLNQAPDPGSVCYYTGEITISQLYIQKVQQKNQIKIVLDVSPNNGAILNNLHIQDMISLALDNALLPPQSYQIVMNPDGTVTITLDYSQDIQNKNLSVLVDFQQNNLFSLLNSTSLSFSVTPANNQGAYFYDQSQYQLAKLVQKLCIGISASALALLFLSLIAGKLVGIEMMAVLQITFFSLLTQSQMNPCFAALSYLWLVNGYNSLTHNKEYLHDPLTPLRPKGLMMFSMLTQNLNFTLLIVFLPLLIALISFILSKTALKNNQNVPKIMKNSLGQYTFMAIMFAGYLISVSFALQMTSGRKNISNIMGKLSITQTPIVLLLIIVYFIFIILKPKIFGEFIQSFKTDRVSQKFYNIMIIERIINGIGLILLLSMKMQGILPISIFIILSIFIIIHKPYKQLYHNYRQIANMVISIVIQLIFLSCNFNNISLINSNKQLIYFYLPIVICGLLIICVTYNGVAIGYSLYLKFVRQSLQKFQKKQFDQFMKIKKFGISFNQPDKRAITNELSQRSKNKDQKKILDNLKQQLALNFSHKLNQQQTMQQFNQTDVLNAYGEI